MATVLVLYHQPADPAVFDAYYQQNHIPLAKKIPGLRSFKTSRGPITTPAGPSPYYLVAELIFDTMADLEASNGTPEGQAAGADLANFAQAGVTFAIYETRAA